MQKRLNFESTVGERHQLGVTAATVIIAAESCVVRWCGLTVSAGLPAPAAICALMGLFAMQIGAATAHTLRNREGRWPNFEWLKSVWPPQSPRNLSRGQGPTAPPPRWRKCSSRLQKRATQLTRRLTLTRGATPRCEHPGRGGCRASPPTSTPGPSGVEAGLRPRVILS